MTILQVAVLTVVTTAIVAAWVRHTLEHRPLRRAAELYLWLFPIALFATLPLLHDSRGLATTATAGAAGLVALAVSFWSLAAPRAGAGREAACWSAFLLLLGSGVVWLGAVTFVGMELPPIHAHRADHLFTTGMFFLGMVITLAGLNALTSGLRQAGAPALSELGWAAFFFGSVFFVIHLAFRAVPMVAAAEELSATGAAPAWYPTARLSAGLMYGLYMALAYLSMSAYGGAMRAAGWAGRGWGRALVAAGTMAAAGFVAFRAFDLPLLAQVMPYAIGMLMLRRFRRRQAAAPAVAAAAW